MTGRTDTALLVIDVQESFRQRTEEWAHTANPSVLDNIAVLVERAREAAATIVWVTHAEPGSGGVFDPDEGFVRVMADFAPLDGELEITKTSVNSFTSTDLNEQLTRRGVRLLAVCGIRTEQCCETTARVASDLGYRVDFVTDATTTSEIPAGPGYGAVSGQDLMRRSESILGARGFASIVRTAEWRATS